MDKDPYKLRLGDFVPYIGAVNYCNRTFECEKNGNYFSPFKKDLAGLTLVLWNTLTIGSCFYFVALKTKDLVDILLSQN